MGVTFFYHASPRAAVCAQAQVRLGGRLSGTDHDGLSTDLFVQRELLGPSGAVPATVEAHASALRFMVRGTCPFASKYEAAALKRRGACVSLDACPPPSSAASQVATICSPLLLNLPRAKVASVRFTYFTTMRADASVRACQRVHACANGTPLLSFKALNFIAFEVSYVLPLPHRQVASRSEVDGNVYFNVMVLQQQCCLDPAKLPGSGGDVCWEDWRRWLVSPRADGAAGAATAGQRRAWRYWLERCAMALGHGPPTGLYDADVRRRFRDMVGSTAGGEGGPAGGVAAGIARPRSRAI